MFGEASVNQSVHCFRIDTGLRMNRFHGQERLSDKQFDRSAARGKDSGVRLRKRRDVDRWPCGEIAELLRERRPVKTQFVEGERCHASSTSEAGPSGLFAI